MAAILLSLPIISRLSVIIGAPGRNRTTDTQIFSLVLYLLSYRSILAPRTGLEPVTDCLEGSCCCPSELSGHKIHCVRLSRFRPGTRQSGQRAQLLYSFLEQKVRVELTNERFAVSYSADECLPHIQDSGTITANGTKIYYAV